MKKDYKSVLGLNTVKAFIVVMLSLAIIGVVTLVVLGAINSSQLNIKTDSTTLSVNTSTVKIMNFSTSYTVSTNSNCQLTISKISNSTSTTACATSDYTVSGCTITPLVSASTVCNNTIWYIAGQYKDTRSIDSVISNTSNGITSFFSNAGTYFALLGVVVIILIISLVVVVVNRFGGESSGGAL